MPRCHFPLDPTTQPIKRPSPILLIATSIPAADHPNFSGIYPHLAFFNDENECGTGAVVPWAVTYAPHKPTGSSDKLYQISTDLKLTVRPESIGGIGCYHLDPDNKTALRVGAIDDIWQLGKPAGHGGPWKDTPVVADVPSDPHLMTGYDQKTLTLSSTPGATVIVEVDITGTGHWLIYNHSDLTPANHTITHTFPDHFQAYWLRTTSLQDTTATAQLTYE